MKQREIWLANLNPTMGQEQNGIRPVVIISGDAMNLHLKIHIVCPITSKIKNYAGDILLRAGEQTGLDLDSEVLTFQIRTLAGKRFLKKLGEISPEQLAEIKTKLQEILTY